MCLRNDLPICLRFNGAEKTPLFEVLDEHPQQTTPRGSSRVASMNRETPSAHGKMKVLISRNMGYSNPPKNEGLWVPMEETTDALKVANSVAFIGTLMAKTLYH